MVRPRSRRTKGTTLAKRYKQAATVHGVACKCAVHPAQREVHAGYDAMCKAL